MSQSPKPGGFNFVSLIIGIVMMVGGMYLSLNMPESMKTSLDALAKQGVPLDPGKTIAAIGVFLILFPVMRTFFFGPLDEAIGNRTRELEQTFSEAENLRSEMTSLRNDYETRLTRTEEEARSQIQAQVKEAQALSQQLRAEAAAQAEELKKNAAAEIAVERDRVMRDLQLSVVNLTLQATEKLIGENVDSDKNRKLVQEFIEKVEVPR